MGHTLAAHSLDRGRGNYAGFQLPVLEQGHRHALTVDLPASASFHIGAFWFFMFCHSGCKASDRPGRPAYLVPAMSPVSI